MRNLKYTLNEAIDIFNSKRYTLLATEYVDVKHKMPFICELHKDKGVMFINLDSINKGKGCKYCGELKKANSKKTDCDVALLNLIKAHDNYYKYPDFKYLGNGLKIKIRCPIHGDFLQRYSAHLCGQGCPKCARENSGFSRTDWINMGKVSPNFDSFKLYVIRCHNDIESFYKIGITFRSVSERFIDSKKMPYDYEIVEIIESDDGEYIWDLEKERHRDLKKCQYTPLIHFLGMYECFSELR